MEIVIFILSCWGLTQIIVYGSIFDKIRPKRKFFHCPMCIGFHVGYVVYTLLLLIDGTAMNAGTLLQMFLAGCVSSATSYALCMFISDDGLKISRGDKDEL